MKVSRTQLLITLLAAGAAGLTLPITNLLGARHPMPTAAGSNPEFARISPVLQASCMDCHTPHLTNYPIYFRFPIANRIIAEDIRNAQASFILTTDELTGKTPLSAPQMVKLEKVFDNGSMPPARYRVMHWNAIISRRQQEDILLWLRKENPNHGIAAIPSKNPLQPEVGKVALGRLLYSDKRLSGDDSISCATCHNLDKGGVDQAPVSTGIHGQLGPINAPTVYNAAFNLSQFWDGRARNLEEQAAGPVNNPREMGSNWTQVLGKLSKDPHLMRQCEAVYPDGISIIAITDAIAAYEKTLITPGCRFDRFLNGDAAALTDQEKQGYNLFVKNGCVSCHTGVNLGSASYEKTGLRKDYFAWRGHPTEADNGRFNVTHEEADRHKFKVPTLRNIALTYPYFHDGSVSDLTKAVKIMSEFQLGYSLTEEEAKLIVQFLNTLTGDSGGRPLTDATLSTHVPRP